METGFDIRSHRSLILLVYASHGRDLPQYLSNCHYDMERSGSCLFAQRCCRYVSHLKIVT